MLSPFITIPIVYALAYILLREEDENRDRSIMTTVRELLWYLNLYKKCPKCQGTVVEVGFECHYKCSNPDCDFGKRRKWW